MGPHVPTVAVRDKDCTTAATITSAIFERSSGFTGRRSGSGLTRVLCSCSRSGRWTCRSRTWRRWCGKCNDALIAA